VVLSRVFLYLVRVPFFLLFDSFTDNVSIRHRPDPLHPRVQRYTFRAHTHGKYGECPAYGNPGWSRDAIEGRELEYLSPMTCRANEVVLVNSAFILCRSYLSPWCTGFADTSIYFF
jgi:hypothetical protein